MQSSPGHIAGQLLLIESAKDVQNTLAGLLCPLRHAEVGSVCMPFQHDDAESVPKTVLQG